MRTIIHELADIPEREALAVIINCSTKRVTTLALASALHHAKLPTVLIDCNSDDGSEEHFERLGQLPGWNFYWLSWPMCRHGITLDRVFRESQANQILLVDSDVEIPNPDIVEEMLELALEPNSYGAGYLHESQWLGESHGVPSGAGRYMERMWIPLVLIKTEPVRSLLDAGFSFLVQRKFYGTSRFRSLAMLYGLRAWLPFVNRVQKPVFIEYDTGAVLHGELLSRGKYLAEVRSVPQSQVPHFHGVTRSKNRRWLRAIAERLHLIRRAENFASEAQINRTVDARLAHYAVDVSKFE